MPAVPLRDGPVSEPFVPSTLQVDRPYRMIDFKPSARVFLPNGKARKKRRRSKKEHREGKMFGRLFGNRPPRDLEREMVQQANGIAQVFTYIERRGAIPARDGCEDLPLDDEDNRVAIVDAVNRIVSENNLTDLDGRSKTAFFAGKVFEFRRNPPSGVDDAAWCIASFMNNTDMISRTYYHEFPNHKPLFEMVNTLAKIVCPGLEQVFGDDLPLEVRRAWPHLSQMFEGYRANFAWR